MLVNQIIHIVLGLHEEGGEDRFVVGEGFAVRVVEVGVVVDVGFFGAALLGEAAEFYLHGCCC